MKIRRGAAFIADWYIIALIMNAVLVLFQYMQDHVLISNVVTITYFDSTHQLLYMLILLLIQLLYFSVIPAWLLHGQTLGKKLMKIRVVNKDGSQAGFGKLLRRDLLGTVLIEGSFYPCSNYLRNVLLLVLERDIIQLLIYLSYFTGLVSVLLLLFGRKERMLHDVIAGTMVVMA